MIRNTYVTHGIFETWEIDLIGVVAERRMQICNDESSVIHEQVWKVDPAFEPTATDFEAYFRFAAAHRSMVGDDVRSALDALKADNPEAYDLHIAPLLRDPSTQGEW